MAFPEWLQNHSHFSFTFTVALPIMSAFSKKIQYTRIKVKKMFGHHMWGNVLAQSIRHWPGMGFDGIEVPQDYITVTKSINQTQSLQCCLSVMTCKAGNFWGEFHAICKSWRTELFQQLIDQDKRQFIGESISISLAMAPESLNSWIQSSEFLSISFSSCFCVLHSTWGATWCWCFGVASKSQGFDLAAYRQHWQHWQWE